jgi:hypothetical protein
VDEVEDLEDIDDVNFVSSSNDNEVDDAQNNDPYLDDDEEPSNLRAQVRFCLVFFVG